MKGLDIINSKRWIWSLLDSGSNLSYVYMSYRNWNWYWSFRFLLLFFINFTLCNLFRLTPEVWRRFGGVECRTATWSVWWQRKLRRRRTTANPWCPVGRLQLAERGTPAVESYPENQYIIIIVIIIKILTKFEFRWSGNPVVAFSVKNMLMMPRDFFFRFTLIKTIIRIKMLSKNREKPEKWICERLFIDWYAEITP